MDQGVTYRIPGYAEARTWPQLGYHTLPNWLNSSEKNVWTHPVLRNTLLTPSWLWLHNVRLIPVGMCRVWNSKANEMRQVWCWYAVREEPFKIRNLTPRESLNGSATCSVQDEDTNRKRSKKKRIAEIPKVPRADRSRLFWRWQRASKDSSKNHALHSKSTSPLAWYHFVPVCPVTISIIGCYFNNSSLCMSFLPLGIE